MIAPNGKVKVNLSPLEETMLIPLWARALELKESMPVLRDEGAAEVVEKLGL